MPDKKSLHGAKDLGLPLTFYQMSTLSLQTTQKQLINKEGVTVSSRHYHTKALSIREHWKPISKLINPET